MSDGHDPCRKCGGNLWMHTHEMLQACGVVPDPKGEEIERLRVALAGATERAELADRARDEMAIMLAAEKADLAAARALLWECIADTWPDGLFARIRAHLEVR